MSSLLTAVTGLVAHQRMLDVVSNNLANMNTTAYKGGDVVFSDLLYTTIRPATNSSDADLGGTNPNQIGAGVNLAQTRRSWGQGNLEQTGQLFDFGIQGDGFFVLSDGEGSSYTRAGSFALDGSNTLVDPATGLRVQRYGTLGEPDGVNPGFQTSGDYGINIPLGATIAGEATSELDIAGNFNAEAIGPLAEVLTSTNPFLASGSAATAVTTLNSLDTVTTPYVGGDSITITGTDADGSAVSATLAVDGTTTMADLVAAISGAYSGATATLDASGNVVLTADAAGEANLSLLIEDAGGNTGDVDWLTHRMFTSTTGKEGDTVDTSLEVYDSRGGAHTVVLTFQKQANNSWDMTATLGSGDGTVVDGSITDIRFQDDGQFDNAVGTGAGDTNLTFLFDGFATAQTIDVSVDRLTHYVSTSTLSMDQNGYPPGSLSSINVTSEGIISGVATNGREIPIAQLALASFSNTQGLKASGNNYFEESPNAGSPQIGAALSGGRGMIRGAQLEASNVDIAVEFTKLIVAQRGFSANARTITVSAEILEELSNIVR